MMILILLSESIHKHKRPSYMSKKWMRGLNRPFKTANLACRVLRRSEGGEFQYQDVKEEQRRKDTVKRKVTLPINLLVPWLPVKSILDELFVSGPLENRG
jgi:hypothetical protein